MLDVHRKYSELIKDVFRGDQAFVTALGKACSVVVNHRPVPRQPARAPELVRILNNLSKCFSVICLVISNIHYFNLAC